MELSIGIWMDSDEAVLINAKSGELNRILSDVEHFHPSGGHGGSKAYSPQEVASESKLLERKKHQLKNYFDAIIDELKHADAIVVFGPGETKKAFKKEAEKNSILKNKSILLETTDKMTDNQMIEWVKNYFLK